MFRKISIGKGVFFKFIGQVTMRSVHSTSVLDSSVNRETSSLHCNKNIRSSSRLQGGQHLLNSIIERCKQ